MTQPAVASRDLFTNGQGRERKTDGYLNHLGLMDVGSLRATNNLTYPGLSQGAGLELIYDRPSLSSYVISYDRGANLYRDLVLSARNITLQPLAGGTVRLPAGSAQSFISNSYFNDVLWSVPAVTSWQETPVQVTYTSTGVLTRFEWQALIFCPTAGMDVVISFGFDGAITSFHVGRMSCPMSASNAFMSGVVYATPSAGVHRAALFMYCSLAGGGLTNAGKSGLWITEQRA